MTTTIRKPQVARRLEGDALLDALVRHPQPGMAIPTRVTFNLDGSAVTFLYPEDDSDRLSLFRRDLQGGETRALSHGDLQQAVDARHQFREELWQQRTREKLRGITSYHRAEQADRLLTVVSGRVLTSDGTSELAPVRQLAGVEAARLSPDGARIAVVRGGDLAVVTAQGELVRLTHDAGDGSFNGLPEYIAAEELDRFDGMWWSTNGDALAFAHVDEREVERLVLSRVDGPRAATEEHRYPFAGSRNARVTLRVAGLGAGSAPNVVDVALPLEEAYLARVIPHPLGGWLAAVLPRPQRSLDWFRVGEDGTVTDLWREDGDPWINLDDGTHVLADGRVLCTTETTGFRHLELRGADGELERRLTSGAWVVTELAHVDEQRGEVLFLGTADGVLERHLYTVPLDAPAPIERPQRLTAEPGWHEVVVSRNGDLWADTWSTMDAAPAVVIRHRDPAAPTFELHASSASAAELGLIAPDLLTLPAADGTTPLHVAIYRPAHSRRGMEELAPPTVVWVYGGPHSQHVCNGWEMAVNHWRQALAAAGFQVVVADNRGTANRGVAFESVVRHQLGGTEVQDQAAVVLALADRGELDPARVGITGWSYGGFMTIRAMLDRPDVFPAGMAGAPVTAWDGYDTAYTERYLGTPENEPEAYERSSLVSRAASLRGHLLLIHGAVDENVHLRHTGRLLSVLQTAGLSADLMLLPRARHLTSPNVLSAVIRRTISHFREALGGDDEGNA